MVFRLAQRRSDIDYEFFFNYSLDMFVVAGLDGYFKRVNPAFCKLLGYSETQLLARPYVDFVHPEDVETVAGAVTNLKSGHPAFLVAVRLLCTDGSYRLLEWSAYPDLETGLLFAIARDTRPAQFEGELRLLIDSSPTAIFLVDETGTLTYSNPLAASTFGYEPGELPGQPVETLVPEQYRRAHVKHRKTYTSEPELRPMGKLQHLVGRRKDGSEFPIDVGLNPVRLGQGAIIICSVIDTSPKDGLVTNLLQEKTKLERANARLGRLADHDTLTKLYNRRAYERILLGELGAARQVGGTLSIILADIDHFKDYNDTFGHPAGDEVLKRLGTLLSLNVRKKDTVARVGGEEFVIILPEVQYQQAIHFGERLRKIVEQDRTASRVMTISLGASTYTFSSKRSSLKRVMQQLIAEADGAMYHAKTAGRNRISHALDLQPMGPDYQLPIAKSAKLQEDESLERRE